MRAMLMCGLCVAMFSVGLTGCLPAPDALPDPIKVADGLQAQYLAANAPHPYTLDVARDGRVFYTEKNSGQIRVIKDGAVLDQPFASVPVNYAGDRGLLGIALHPDFARNGRVYVFYTRSDTGESTDDPQAVIDHRIVYFEADDENPDIAGSGEVFVTSLTAGATTERIGGYLLFLVDGSLLVAFGDLGDAQAAQSGSRLHGKMLRYNADGTIPDDNPTEGSAVYARGIGAPRGLGRDPQTFDVFFSEQAGDGVYELNRLQAGGNYGWPTVVGQADTAEEQAFVNDNLATYVDPLVQTSRRVVGAAINPSSKYGPGFLYNLVYGVSDTGDIFAVQLTQDRTDAVATAQLAFQFPTPMTSVAFTRAGTLYVTTAAAVFRVNNVSP